MALTSRPMAVLGAGAWGTALAISAARHNPQVTLWARDAAQVADMGASRRNARYLPDVAFPDALQLSADFSATVNAVVQAPGLLILASPMAGLADLLARLPDGARALWLCKGFEKGTGRLGHEVAQTVRPQVRSGVLSGPSFALEVAQGQPPPWWPPAPMPN